MAIDRDMLVVLVCYSSMLQLLRMTRGENVRLAAHLAVAFLPYLDESPVEDFWEYNKRLFGNFMVGAFYALGKKQSPYTDLAPLIEKTVKAFGPDRCMWESDCPFQVAKHKYTDSLDLVRTRLDFLSADDRAWLLRKTAENFFFKK